MANKERFFLINTVAERAFAVSEGMHLGYSKLEWLMDIEFADLDCELNLCALAAAPPIDFNHDVFGIRKHLNRETKKLEGCFLPRYAA